MLLYEMLIAFAVYGLPAWALLGFAVWLEKRGSKKGSERGE